MASNAVKAFVTGFAQQELKNIEGAKEAAGKEYDRMKALQEAFAIEEYKTRKTKRDRSVAIADELEAAQDPRLFTQKALLAQGHSSEDVNYWTGDEVWNSKQGEALRKAAETQRQQLIDYYRSAPDVKFSMVSDPKAREEYQAHAARGIGLMKHLNAMTGGTMTRLAEPPSMETMMRRSNELIYQPEDTRVAPDYMSQVASIGLGPRKDKYDVSVTKDHIVYTNPRNPEDRKVIPIDEAGTGVSSGLDPESPIGKLYADLAAVNRQIAASPDDQTLIDAKDALERSIAEEGYIKVQTTLADGTILDQYLDPRTNEPAFVGTKQEAPSVAGPRIEQTTGDYVMSLAEEDTALGKMLSDMINGSDEEATSYLTFENAVADRVDALIEENPKMSERAAQKQAVEELSPALVRKEGFLGIDPSKIPGPLQGLLTKVKYEDTVEPVAPTPAPRANPKAEEQLLTYVGTPEWETRKQQFQEALGYLPDFAR